MAKKYVKCPRCELNYILEGEDYCSVCKSEMQHHPESDDELLDIEDMDLCPVCGQNYIKEGEPMCEDCRNKGGADEDESEEPAAKVWRESGNDESGISPVSDIDRDDDYDSEYDSEPSEDDPYKEDDDLLGDDDILGDEPIAFEEDEIEEDEEVEQLKDDFEIVEPSADDDDDEDEDDDYDFEDGDMLSKK